MLLMATVRLDNEVDWVKLKGIVLTVVLNYE